MENHHFQWVNPLEMAIFNSYVSLPEGISPSKKKKTTSTCWQLANGTRLTPQLQRRPPRPRGGKEHQHLRHACSWHLAAEFQLGVAWLGLPRGQYRFRCMLDVHSSLDFQSWCLNVSNVFECISHWFQPTWLNPLLVACWIIPWTKACLFQEIRISPKKGNFAFGTSKKPRVFRPQKNCSISL